MASCLHEAVVVFAVGTTGAASSPKISLPSSMPRTHYQEMMERLYSGRTRSGLYRMRHVPPFRFSTKADL